MRAFVIILSLAALTAPAVASAEQTEITVRVLAKDSKFVGTSMGGMRNIYATLTRARSLRRG